MTIFRASVVTSAGGWYGTGMGHIIISGVGGGTIYVGKRAGIKTGGAAYKGVTGVKLPT